MQDESLNSAFYQDADLTIHLAFQVSGCKCPFNARKLNRVIVILSKYVSLEARYFVYVFQCFKYVHLVICLPFVNP